jgi:LCP family protein required for cell wall assembly
VSYDWGNAPASTEQSAYSGISATDAPDSPYSSDGYSSDGYSGEGYAGNSYGSGTSAASYAGYSDSSSSDDAYPGIASGSGYPGGSYTDSGYGAGGYDASTAPQAAYGNTTYPADAEAGYTSSPDPSSNSYPYESPTSYSPYGSSYTDDVSAQSSWIAPETRAHDAVPYSGYQPPSGAESYLAPETRAHEVPTSPYGGYPEDYSTGYSTDYGTGYSTDNAPEYGTGYSTAYPAAGSSEYGSDNPDPYSGEPYAGDYSTQYSGDYSAGPEGDPHTGYPSQVYGVAPETRAHETLPYSGYLAAGGPESYLAPETRAHEVPPTPYAAYATDYSAGYATDYPSGYAPDYSSGYATDYTTGESTAYPSGYPGEQPSGDYATGEYATGDYSAQAYALAPETRAHESVPYPDYSSGSLSDYALAPETRAHEPVPYPDYSYPDYGVGGTTEAYAGSLAPPSADPYAPPSDDFRYPASDGAFGREADLDEEEDRDFPPGEPGVGRRHGAGGGDRFGAAPLRRRRRWIAWLTVLVLLLGLGGVAYLKLSGNFSRLGLSGALSDGGSAAGAASHSAMNVLVLGSDTRTGIDSTGSNTAAATDSGNADTSMLVHLSADRRTVTVVSIPRDSMVQAPRDCSDPNSNVADGVIRQWNANFNRGGPACTIRAFEGNTSIQVDHFVVVDFGGFQKVVDALGGVDVCTPTAIHDKDGLLDLAAGRNHLDGEQALGYVRVRKSLGDGSDIGRIKRQQAFLSSIAQEATSSSLLKRPDKLYRFLMTASSSMTVDSGLNVGAMKDLALSLKNVGLENIQFVTVPNEPYPLNPNRVQWTPAADQLWAAIRDDAPLPGTKAAGAGAAGARTAGAADPTVSPADIRLRLVNDTGVAGLARATAEPLQVQGFKIESWVSGKAGAVNGVEVRYGPSQADAAKTVAAAFPGAKLVASSTLGSVIEVHLGMGAPSVVEVPNRLGTQPLPKPSIKAPPAPKSSATFKPRTAAQDICK